MELLWPVFFCPLSSSLCLSIYLNAFVVWVVTLALVKSITKHGDTSHPRFASNPISLMGTFKKESNLSQSPRGVFQYIFNQAAINDSISLYHLEVM